MLLFIKNFFLYFYERVKTSARERERERERERRAAIIDTTLGTHIRNSTSSLTGVLIQNRLSAGGGGTYPPLLLSLSSSFSLPLLSFSLILSFFLSLSLSLSQSLFPVFTFLYLLSHTFPLSVLLYPSFFSFSIPPSLSFSHTHSLPIFPSLLLLSLLISLVLSNSLFAFFSLSPSPPSLSR